MERPDFFELKNGEKVKLPFTDKEYNDRVSKLRSVMDLNGLDMVLIPNALLPSLYRLVMFLNPLFNPILCHISIRTHIKTNY